MSPSSRRCAVRCFHNGWPVSVGYPFAKVTVDGDRLAVSCHRASGRFVVPVEGIRKAERTPHGVRLWTDDPSRRFILGSIRVGPLVEMLRRTGIEIDDKITKASWSDV